MIHVVLYQPEIPPNTGNIIRLCANTGAQLHLIHPLGFAWDEKKLKRAGMDYAEFFQVFHYDHLDLFFKDNALDETSSNLYTCTTKGSGHYHQVEFKEKDYLMFGPETRGLPDSMLASVPTSNKIRIPMLPSSRSLNLSNSVAVIVYEALRQLRFKDMV